MIENDSKNGIFNRHQPSRDKNTRGIAFRAGKVIQSAEMNEMQSIEHARHRRVSDVMLREGDIVAGGVARLDPDTGELSIEKASVYLDGDIHDVEPQTLTISVTDDVTVGVWLIENYLTELDDPSLRNPAVGTRGANEPGAWRTIYETQWGTPENPPLGDDKSVNFYPVYQAKRGYLSAKEPPPHITAVTQAIAKYDVDSTGSEYIINGLSVRAVAGDGTEPQTYLIDAGRARIGGFAIEYPAARRIDFDARPQMMTVEGEPHLASGGSQRIWLNRRPLSAIEKVSITAEKTVTMTHANFNNSSDLLPDASVVSIISVSQGDVTYVEGNDFALMTGKIDWSLDGAEPATGSTYEVTYHYIRTTEVSDITDVGFVVDGAVSGSLILVDYTYHLPRLDRLCLDSEGEPQWLVGIAAPETPLPPAVPDNLLLLATIEQDWASTAETRPIRQDGNRLVTMSDLNTHNRRLDYLTEMLAQTRLEQTSSMQEAGRKRGLFADPFLSDNFRDLGSPQTAIVGGGILQLNIAPTAHWFTLDAPMTLPAENQVIVSQDAVTECLQINPYQAFDVLPALVDLSPDIDRWTVKKQAIVEEDSAEVLIHGSLWARTARPSSTLTLLSSESEALTFCRPIDVMVSVSGFGAGEFLDGVTFDGIPVAANGQVKADADGKLQFSITIPEKVPAGTKRVEVVGRGGTRGDAFFIADGKLITENFRRTRFSYIKNDPLAQTFTLSSLRQIAALEVWLCTVGQRPIRAQIRETLVGIPTQKILGEASLTPSQQTKGSNTFVFDSPIALSANVEYAIVILSDEAEPAVEVATLGEFDEKQQRWVTAQPYTVGALLSSSNASTWTPHNDKDLRFRLLATHYQQLTRNVDIGVLTVSEITDIAVFFTREIIGGGDNVTIVATMPDGRVLHLADGQTTAFNEPISGEITFTAKLMGTTTTAPILHKHIQVITGKIKNTGNYITRAIPAGANCRVRVLIDAFLPAGSQLQTFTRTDTQADWQALDRIGDRQLDDGQVELTYETGSTISATTVQVELRLSGHAGARPQLANLRTLVIEN
ncbi:MAG: hypothetical protein CR975_02115 [Gammaproteobacteria bacterium]|nr:MAG: hypothetical protein CR975_02115 [Gammaproteobacteria bacterium]